MTEQLIKIEDLDNIVCSNYAADKIIDAIAKYYNLTAKDIVVSTRRYVFRPYIVFLLRYFNIQYTEICKLLSIGNNYVPPIMKNLTPTFFKDKATIDLFLFVLQELRQSNQNS